MADDQPIETDALLARARCGDGAAWGRLLTSHQQRLVRMVCFRMDKRLRGRVDAADVVQDAFAEAAAHRDDYFRAAAAAGDAAAADADADADATDAGAAAAAAAAAPLPLVVWLRGVALNKLLEAHRHHLGTRMRDARRERPLEAPGYAAADTSAALCAHLTAGLTRPSVAAARAEARTRVAAALDAIDPADREVLALRHYEQLTNAEAARVLGIQERAAAKRYLRALRRLKLLLSELPGGLSEIRP